MLKYEEATMEIIPLGDDVVCASVIDTGDVGDGEWGEGLPKNP